MDLDEPFPCLVGRATRRSTSLPVFLLILVSKSLIFTLAVNYQTGFSQGEPDISNDDELAAQLVGFLEQFLEVFSELKGLDFYLAGESVRNSFIVQLWYCLTYIRSVSDLSMLATVSISPFFSNEACLHFLIITSMSDVPYIANYIYENPGLDLNLKGISIADPSLSWGLVQEQIPALRFVQVHSLFSSFPSTSRISAHLMRVNRTTKTSSPLTQR